MPHKTEIVKDGREQYRAICTCRTSSAFSANRQEIEDWVLRHQRLAEQAMTHLRSKNPSIKDQYTYYSERAVDPQETPENRRLWQQLADELRYRVPVTSTDEALPLDVKYTPRNRSRRDDP